MADGVFEAGRKHAASAEGATRAKLFMHGGSQAVRLPKAFRFSGTEVVVRREGDTVILEPVPAGRRQTPDERAAFWKALDALGSEPMDYPPRDERLWRDPPAFDAS